MTNVRLLLTALLLTGCSDCYDVHGDVPEPDGSAEGRGSAGALADAGPLLEPHDEVLMGLSEQYGIYGLITDPSPQQLQRGALKTAHNVVFRRPNMAEPRPGFDVGPDTPMGFYEGLIAFDGRLLGIGKTSSARRTYWDNNNTALTDESSAHLQWNYPFMRGAVARQSLYLTTTDAVRKLDSGSDLVASRAGISPIPYVSASVFVSLTASQNWLSTNKQVAYRSTISRRDGNGVTVTSGASARLLIENGGATSGVQLTIYLDTDHATGDSLRVYRSSQVANTVIPSDDMRLIQD